jgi:hypothetical protein
VLKCDRSFMVPVYTRSVGHSRQHTTVSVPYLLVTRNPTSLHYRLQMTASGGTAISSPHSAIKLQPDSTKLHGAISQKIITFHDLCYTVETDPYMVTQSLKHDRNIPAHDSSNSPCLPVFQDL